MITANIEPSEITRFEFMILGTSYSPSKAFIEFARNFFEAVAQGDFGVALGGLDARASRWNRQKLLDAINTVTDGQGLCTCHGIMQSAKPVMTEIETGCYSLQHRLPVSGKWAKAYAVFLFKQKASSYYFHVTLDQISA